jgi:hypothetical protein
MQPYDLGLQKWSKTVKVSDLARKLGIKPGMMVLLQDAPAGFPELLGNLPNGAKLLKIARVETDCVITFVRTKADVRTKAPAVLKAMGNKGLVWFAYPKKSGALQSDLSRDSGWEPLFEAGFDSVAQISIDETWTGFRFRPRHLVGR